MAVGRGGQATNNIQNCIAYCDAAGFTVAGTEFANECYCGNALANGAAVAPADTQCNMACAGDAAHACGGANRVSVYASTPTVTVYPVPTAKTTGLIGKYVHQGCYGEPGGGNTVFKYKIESISGNTVNTCLTRCSTFGYAAAALEYGQECWCGDVSQLVPNGGFKAPEADCNMFCSGAPTELCGGVQRFQYYTWTSTTDPLYVWNTPANTGHYELLIGGIVIPLIATLGKPFLLFSAALLFARVRCNNLLMIGLGVNNKVTFMEKYGTGAPNSTGAYELDYSLANDYTKAWRTMHVVSDVFVRDKFFSK